jgi:hypothetical protein
VWTNQREASKVIATDAGRLQKGPPRHGRSRTGGGSDLTEFGELDMVGLMEQKCPELGPTGQADRAKW